MKENNLSETEIDPQKQEKARELAKISRTLSIAGIIISFAYFSIALFSGLSVMIRDYAISLTDSWFLRISVYSLIFFAIPSLFTSPLSFYEEYYLQKKYGLLKQGLGGWLLDELKKTLLSVIIGIPLLALLYKALIWQGNNWWISVSIGYFVISLLAMVIVPVIIMPMFAKYTPVEDEALLNTLSELSKKTGTNIKGVFRWGLGEKTVQANAALTGFGNTRRIIISDTMLDNYTNEEIETVLAHEMGHHVNKDIPRMLTLGTLITTVSLYLSSIVLEKASNMWGLNGLSDFANLPLLLLVLSFLSLLVMPLINSYSRHRERHADLYSFRITKKPMVLADALKKLSNQNLSDTSPPKIIEFIFYSHPSVESRVNFARKYQENLNAG